MKKTKRIVAFALAAVLALLVLVGCKSTLTSIAHKLTGSSDEVQEEDTTQWAVLSSDPLMIDGITDTSAKYATAMANGSLNIVFNGVWSRQTDYFTAPNGMISVYGCGTAEGVQKFKISLWKKVDGGAEYVDNTTFYFVTDGQNYHCDIGNLDPNASYRLTISYDSSKYYLYGLLKVEGIG